MKKVLKKTINPQSSKKNSKRVVGLLQRKAVYTFTERRKLQAVRACDHHKMPTSVEVMSAGRMIMAQGIEEMKRTRIMPDASE